MPLLALSSGNIEEEVSISLSVVKKKNIGKESKLTSLLCLPDWKKEVTGACGWSKGVKVNDFDLWSKWMTSGGAAAEATSGLCRSKPPEKRGVDVGGDAEVDEEALATWSESLY